MNIALPPNVQKYIEALPIDKTDATVIADISKFRSLYGDKYIESIIWTQEDAIKILGKLGISTGSDFYNFYLNSFDFPDTYRNVQLYGLSEIFNDYIHPFWGERYPGIEKKYLQLSSIEGEYSYFYDKTNGGVFGVDWADIPEFIAGNLPPIFNSFYNFLDWYFSERE